MHIRQAVKHRLVLAIVPKSFTNTKSVHVRHVIIATRAHHPSIVLCDKPNHALLACLSTVHTEIQEVREMRYSKVDASSR